jgi:glycine cleavage system H protein
LKGDASMSDWKIVDDRKYSKTDEWIKVDGQEALVGLSDYAQNQLSDLVFVELPAVGTTYAAGQSFGVVESVKAAADVNLPASGEIVAVNTELESAPETINQDAYGKGWIVRVKLSHPSELDSLLDAAAYTAYCNERS